MASNRDRAAEVLAQDRCWIPGPGGMERFSVAEGADALAAAGVLADDLPAPDEGEWVVGPNVISLDGMHILPMIDNDALTPDKARALALALWAAAAHAETEVTDG